MWVQFENKNSSAKPMPRFSVTTIIYILCFKKKSYKKPKKLDCPRYSRALPKKSSWFYMIWLKDNENQSNNTKQWVNKRSTRGHRFRSFGPRHPPTVPKWQVAWVVDWRQQIFGQGHWEWRPLRIECIICLLLRPFSYKVWHLLEFRTLKCLLLPSGDLYL